MSKYQDVVQLPVRFLDPSDLELFAAAIQRNFAEIERCLSILQLKVKQATGGAVKDLPTRAGVWDRASNINPDGTISPERILKWLAGRSGTAFPTDPYDGELFYRTDENAVYRYSASTSSWIAVDKVVDAYRLADGIITVTKLANGCVTAEKIADGAVREQKIAEAAVTATKIATGAVDVAKFAQGTRPVQIVSSLPALPDSNYPQGAVVFLTTDNKLYRCTGTEWTAVVPAVDIIGQLTSSQIADAAITAAKIASGAIEVAKFASGIRPVQIISSLPQLPSSDYPEGAVVYLTTDGKLYRSTGSSWTATVSATDITGQITSAQISDNAITAPKLAANAVTADKITANAITSDKIDANAVTAGKIAAGAVSADQIAAGAITSDKIQANAVGTTAIAAGAVTADKIAANAITSDKISANAVTAGKIAAGAVGADQIAAGAIVAEKIAAGAVGATAIAAGAVVSDKIAAGAVTADKINVSQLSAISANLGTVTAGTIEADVVIAGQYASKLGKTPATVVVADGSTTQDTKRADFVVPAGSTSAQTVINQAINSLPASGGGKVVLLEGNYIVDGSIVVPSNVTLEGQGKGTVIKIKDALNSYVYVVQNADGTNGNTRITLKNFVIDGNKANNPLGISYGVIFYQVTYSLISGLLISNCNWGIYLSGGSDNTITENVCQGNIGDDIWLGDNSSGNTVSGNTCRGNDGYGIRLSRSSNNTVTGNTCQGSTFDGIYVYGGSNNNTITGNVCRGNSHNGIFLDGSSNNSVTGNICQGNGYHGIRVYYTKWSTIIANTCLENSQAENNWYDNIRVDGDSDYNNLQANTCRAGSLTNKPRYGISIYMSACDGNLVTNNDLYQGGATGAFYDAGTGTIVAAGNRT